MSQTTIPRTPTPEALDSDGISPIISPSRSKGPLPGTVPHAGAALTPPPSTQYPSSNMKGGHATVLGKRDRSLASPPSTLRVGPPITSGVLFGEVPTMEMVEHMNESELKGLISELLPALGEARVTAAHSKLQHSLLAIESEESIKRAEVEHEATRREVQVLQEGSPAPHHGFSPIGSPQASAQRNVQLALSHCRVLQEDNLILEKRLRSSKRLIAHLHSRNADLKEDIQVLRQRIKDNRDHLNDLQDSGAISITATPQHDFSTPHTRGTPRTPGTGRLARELSRQTIASQDPFDALLQAANLNGEANSVPSSPYQPRQRKAYQHMRGAHSLSSLPTTPERRPVTADAMLITPVERNGNHHVSFSAPGTQLTYELKARPQDDRESTISASDNEEDSHHEQSLPSSQASQMASSMLRRTLETQNEAISPSRQPLSTSKMTQGKLFGHIAKAGAATQYSGSKRKSPFEGHNDSVKTSKKVKASHPAGNVGLGIKSWPSPGL